MAETHTAALSLNGEQLTAHYQEQDKMDTLTLPFNTVLEILARATRQEKEI
jgi:hypothetical protein